MKKFIVMGLDGAVPGIIKEYVDKGLLKNFKRLMDNGVFGTNLPFPSAVTPGNWASIASGSYPGTNGISDFEVHVPGEQFINKHSVFDAEWCKAELMWDAMSRQGYRVATINYPCGRPRRNQRHTSIGDNGMPVENSYEYMLAPARLFVAGDLNPVGPFNWKEHERLEMIRSVDWLNLPEGYTAVKEFKICVEAKNPECRGSWPLYILIVRADGQKKVVISPERDYDKKVSKVGLCCWSQWIERKFEIKGITVDALFRFRPVIIDDNGNFQLYLSPIYPKDHFADPIEYSKKLYDKLGPYCDVLNISKLIMNWLDPQGLLDEFRMQGVWQAKASLELVNNFRHTGVFSKWHAFDKFYHLFLSKIDPISPRFKEEEFEYYEKIHRGILEIADEMVGIVLDGMDKDTTLFVLSDHGLEASRKFAWVNNFLVKHGYISTYINEEGKEMIDWNRTKAVMHPYVIIWINLKGRDPQGCVDPDEYDIVCDEIIDLLRGWKDPETSQHVMAEVFKTSDGAFYGLWGDRDGDIRVFTAQGYTLYRSNDITEDRCFITDLNGPYSGDHGSNCPTSKSGRGSTIGLFSAVGNGIRRKYCRNMPIKPCDIVPTICRIIGTKPPKDCEGAVIYDILNIGL